MEVALDSSFIIICVKNHVDFLGKLYEDGFRVVVTREVMQELKDLRTKVSHVDRVAVDIALRLLEGNNVEKIRLGKRSVDEGLIALGRKGAYIATADAAIKRAVPNRVVFVSATKSLMVERD